jgi:4a-hydroxytetrahydrobiopterin dehydratase
MMKKLDEARIAEMLADHPDWAVSGGALQRTFNLGGFPDAMEFVNRIATLAEDAQHHPDILVRFNKVTLTLRTHDADGLTEKDFAFASATDALLATMRG